MSNEPYFVCVVLVTYNGEKWVRDALCSLANSTVKSHVIVVDNASTDATPDIIGNEFSNVELIKLNQNKGFGIGNNIGIARALSLGAEFIFLLNQDAFVVPETIAQSIRFMEGNVDVGVMSPLHCSPTLESVDYKIISNYLRRYAPNYISDACVGAVKSYYDIKGINAAAWFVRASVFKMVGGFDPLFFMYGEDDDLINRFFYHHIKFVLVPNIKIVHVRESPVSKISSFWESVKKTSERVRSSILVELKKPNLSFSLMIMILISEGLLKPVAEYLIVRNGKLFMGSVFAAIRLASELLRIRKHSRLCVIQGAHFLDM